MEMIRAAATISPLKVEEHETSSFCNNLQKSKQTRYILFYTNKYEVLIGGGIDKIFIVSRFCCQ